MARKLIPKNAGKFTIGFSMINTYIVTNGKSGGNRIIIPCKSKEQAEKLCKKVNQLDPSREHEIWL
jgi:hypothetical protein